ncbi:hypothetical protein [Elizabethkingia sp. JS20170427COW]|uniref:hypothetical protein n=1 Tax=Elizabethkingia sp. JS20170427COW TaxID=2583851 RepID=UPI001110E68B|nr:hypothetical protein [Elizabethkingia sp. JS20170427COW]QCX52495.1 hypothetical protein FGE20_01400 [Elizabethkingia sp. JS20170427COW]
MEKKNQKFQELVNKMETLKETEKGLLKGGFSSPLSSIDQIAEPNDYCNNNKCTGGGNNRCTNTDCY